MERKIVSGVTLTLILLSVGMLTLAFEIQPTGAESELTLETDKDVYILGEDVKIILTNVGNETEWIGGYPAWIIYTHPEEEWIHPDVFATLLWSLKPGENDTYTWNQRIAHNTTSVQPGMFVIKDTQGWGLTKYFEIKPETTLYVDPSTTTISVDYDFSINVTVADVADLSTFSFRLGYNTTVLYFLSVWVPPPWETPIIILEPDGYVYVSATSPVSFFGTGVLALISFHATAVGECLLDLCDTTLFDSASDFIPHAIIDGSVTISSIPGDVNGDGTVDIYDALLIREAYGSTPGDPNWNPECDLYEDGVINIYDALIVRGNFGEMRARIFPSDDSFVGKEQIVGHDWFDTTDWNYGNSSIMIVSTTTVDGRDRRAFLKFSLSFISSPEDIASVKLFLFKNSYYPPGWGGVGNVEAREVADDSWTEENITWNNQVAYGSLLDTVNIVFGSSQWYSWDVTPFILSELAGNKVASICLKAENEDQGDTYRWSSFYSKEYDGFDPYLLVNMRAQNRLSLIQTIKEPAKCMSS